METGFHISSAVERPFYLSISGVLVELGTYPFVTSRIFLSNYGIVKKYLFYIILSDTLLENCATCFRMYRSNESLCHLLMIIIVNGDNPVRYIAVSAPERRECDTIFTCSNTNCPLPRIWAAARNYV